MDLNFILPTDYSNYGIVFLVGLVAGISTCGGLLSSFVLGLATRYEELNPHEKIKYKLYPHLIFNFGRIFFYTIFGALIGYFGTFLALNNTVLGVAILISSIILLGVGLEILNFKSFLLKCGINISFIDRLFLKHKEKLHSKFGSKLGIFVLGGLTFFLPCGFTQSIQVFAVTQANPFNSALTLLIFCLGTVPGLLALATASTFFSTAKSTWFYKLIGTLVIYFSIINIFNSFRLLGFSFLNSDNKENSFIIKNGFQEVRITQTHQGYFPNIINLKKDIPTKLIILSKNNTTCASYIVIEKYNVREFLNLGENTITFTPNEVGEFPFSCGMGMYPGIIKVTN